MTKNIFIQDITIENYKSLEHFEAKGFGKINLITGKNNVGKTSLLEALYLNLGPGNPTLPLNILSRIGLNRISPEGTTNINYLFSKNNITNSINFNVNTKNHGVNKLEIKLRDALPNEISMINNPIKGEDSINVGTGNIKTLEYKIVRKTQPSITHRLLISPNGVIPLGKPGLPYPDSVFISSELTSSFDNEVDRYDFINKSNLVERFEEVIRIVEPDLRRTSLGINNSLPIILADVGYGLAPLNLLGSGGKKLTQIFLALAYANNSVVLIDEIEGSFHFSKLNDVWKAIIEFVKNNDTQLFATTHSSECLKAAFETSHELGFEDLLLHRLDRKDEKSQLYTFSGQKLESMLENDWELR